MNASQMLHQMCHEELSNADVNAIRRNRGFTKQETASRALLENFYLTDTGVKEMLNSLAEEEIAFLHWLAYVDEPVEIRAFTRIYGDEEGSRYGTYTQRYKPVFKKVRRTLIRKGVLLFAEDYSLLDANDKTKNERRRYRFPPQFKQFLPPLIQAPTTLEGEGEARTGLLRQKLKSVIPDEPPVEGDKAKGHKLRLVNGELHIGPNPFQLKHLLAWQRARWAVAIPSDRDLSSREERRRIIRRSKQGVIVPPIRVGTYAFAQLAEDEWIRPEQLSLPLRIFCAEAIEGEDICTTGWRWGYLAKQEVDGTIYYRSAAKRADENIEPEEYLQVSDGQDLLVNLETIPYQTIDYLNRTTELRVADADGPFLAATPSLTKIGRSLKSIQEQPLTPWLRENAPAFRHALEAAEERWGQQIIHKNLLIAKVDDLGLNVQLEEAFQNPRKVLFLPDDYIAFPQNMLREVKKVVTGAGHVIKEVENDA